MYKDILKPFAVMPEPYESSGIPFWDDPHISGFMLAAHLSPDSDGASRRHEFINESADWIASLMPPEGKRLMDLGCGPGLYAERFCRRGFRVTGLDLSRNSIKYAKSSADAQGLDIEYRCIDYLGIDYENEFDLAVLIYCDFGVLPPDSRALLLKKVNKALKPGGLFILDAFTAGNYTQFCDKTETAYEEGGFWSSEPYLGIKQHKAYPDRLYLERHTIITREECKTHDLWNHAFDADELRGDLSRAGFGSVTLYGDVAGAPYADSGKTICAAAEKR